jgi:hypothetical protein
MMHNFWALPDPAQRLLEIGHFMSNMALLGGTLMMVAIPPPWPYTLTLRRRVRA